MVDYVDMHDSIDFPGCKFKLVGDSFSSDKSIQRDPQRTVRYFSFFKGMTWRDLEKIFNPIAARDFIAL